MKKEKDVAALNDNRIKWACRRGMLELDIFLMTFFEKRYPTLSLAQKEKFACFLEESDADLYVWLMKGVAPPPEWIEIIHAIQNP